MITFVYSSYGRKPEYPEKTDLPDLVTTWPSDIYMGLVINSSLYMSVDLYLLQIRSITLTMIITAYDSGGTWELNTSQRCQLYHQLHTKFWMYQQYKVIYYVVCLHWDNFIMFELSLIWCFCTKDWHFYLPS